MTRCLGRGALLNFFFGGGVGVGGGKTPLKIERNLKTMDKNTRKRNENVRNPQIRSILKLIALR